MLDLLRRWLDPSTAAREVPGLAPPAPPLPPWADPLGRRPAARGFLDGELPPDDDPWSPENYIRALDEARIAAVRRADQLTDALTEREGEIEALKSRLSRLEARSRPPLEAFDPPAEDRPIAGSDFDRLNEKLETFRDLLVHCMREVSADMNARLSQVPGPGAQPRTR